MKEPIFPYDPAEDLDSAEKRAIFIADAFESQQPECIAHALGIVARAIGIEQIARDSGLSRHQLYRSFRKTGSPTLESTLKVMRALGVSLHAITNRTSQSRATAADPSAAA
jgi:probable addiction module antidote protein